jgi:hypothetical protein
MKSLFPVVFAKLLIGRKRSEEMAVKEVAAGAGRKLLGFQGNRNTGM